MVQAVTKCAEQALGDCCLFLAVQELKDAAQQLLDAGAVSTEDAATQQQKQNDAEACVAAAAHPKTLTRRVCCLWFHHIKNLYKRKVILEWARELQLGGASKPGYPGVVLVEGAVEDVQEYVGRLRSLQWKAMQVRAEEDDEIGPDGQGQQGDGASAQPNSTSSLKEAECNSCSKGKKVQAAHAGQECSWRRLPLPLTELPENALGELGAMCKALDLAHIFASALKLPCSS
ncbi:hypothetical protein DUNSADRAFT_5194 [Dunaliella salina]|uniref:Small nuclear ribonucleoprotein Prp3 C-terminal domain-containing protein n=1 Tax=Dunaliella salina TaxID=3046 RepID=A0ABQ7GQS5_DUNSA|nr:hypothetical protein DUNSADRAFT_5194 [Dunaliella salina]|eukprot:KAF5836965.1 hypothetical protein DUNSADRAFT_5194 [Dunaliella salina]